MKKSDDQIIQDFINMLELDISIMKQSEKNADIVRLSNAENLLKVYTAFFNNNF